MEMMKIEKVVVGGDRRTTSAEIKSETVMAPLQPYQQDSLQCFQCFITFSDYKAKERHMKKNHREQYKKQLQEANTVFTCYTCDRSFSSSEELSLHQATHSTKEKPFSCAFCQETFFTSTELTRHRRHACVERRCACSYCGALFPSPSRLRSHRITAHPKLPIGTDDINTHQCLKCSRGFLTEEELLSHQEKILSNQNCDVMPPAKKRGRKPKCAAQVDSKKIKQEEGAEGCAGHNDIAIQECSASEEQPQLKIPCPEADCDLVFPSVAALRAHKKDAHGPPPTSCRIYARSHQIELDHTCLTCGESFSQEGVFKVHQKIHTGEETPQQR